MSKIPHLIKIKHNILVEAENGANHGAQQEWNQH